MMVHRKLVIDTRFEGNHGIARHAREVVKRLRHPWRSLSGSGGNPTSVTNLLNVRRATLSRNTVLYSPGFNVGPGRCVQVPTVHDLIHLQIEQGRRSRAHSLYYNRVLKPTILRNGHVITVSDTSARHIEEWLADTSVQIHVVGNGCSELFMPWGAQLESRRPYVSMLGNLKAHKNTDVAFEMLHELPELDMVVPTNSPRVVFEAAVKHGVRDRVKVIDCPTDARLAEVYRGAVAHVLPSVIEGFGLPALEAMRCGTPVVYFEGCESVREICDDGQFPVQDHGDPVGFARAVEAALGHAQVAPDLSRYSWESVSAKVDDVLSTVTGRSS